MTLQNVSLEDVQNSSDDRAIAIDFVGVSGLRYPITVLDRAHAKQETVAELSLSVGLPHHFKGTHMSRFVEILSEHRGEVTMRTLPTILHSMRNRLEAESAKIRVCFPYFLERSAPVTGAIAMVDYQCTFVGESTGASDSFTLGVEVPITTLCPCSRAISDYGAHNQRGYLTIEVVTRDDGDDGGSLVWIEELIEVAERSGSAPVYALLKRPDERHVTMQAFDNPVFVEDVVRNAAAKLQEDARISWFHVRAINHESIHNHSAFAEITWRRNQEA